MTDAPDYDELARQYLDLWQDQWTALATDPTVAETMAHGFRMMGPGAAAFANFANMLASANLYGAGMGGGWPSAPAAPAAATPTAANPTPTAPATDASPPADNDNNERRQAADTRRQRNQPDAAAGTASAGPAHAERDGDMAQLHDRLAAMEQRLADLASALAATSRSAAPADPDAAADTGTGGGG